MKKNFSSQGLLVIISAPSGARKTSILSELLARYPDIRFSVSVTTRDPRENERDGINYNFVSEEAFDRHIDNGDFVEWAVVHGKRYGTLKKTIQDVLHNNQILILDTDTFGAFNIKNLYQDAVMIFIVPPSLEVLSERLHRRNTESDELIQKRLEVAPHEMARMSEYDYIVLNDTIPQAVIRIRTIIEAEKLRNSRIIPSLTSWREYINGSEKSND